MDSTVSVTLQLLMKLMTDNKNISALNPSRICRFRKSCRIWYS
ncbi:hypothetical protein T01_6449 [Trichinella spiralis]|uniref:Uncharacterized protein n=1 Tax=Trichinella spiralis TaxID=6334 RepID=A0A0V0Z0M6_TRISP|nr:hypothetical protein T01_6449 [Trichinella spiralis]